MFTMSTLAIITARGGSKRIPKKNIKSFCGKPIMAYSIEAAIKSGVFDEVIVSTDSYEIAAIGMEYGAKVPFMRSEKTASDFATTKDVLDEVLLEYKKLGSRFDYMACIYPTAPFINAEKLIEAYSIITSGKVEMVMPIVAYSFPPQRGNVINDSGYIEYRFPEYVSTRSQDLEQWYHDIGQFYFYDVKKYTANNGVITKIKPLLVSELECQDIDNEVDWKLAELKYKLMCGSAEKND